MTKKKDICETDHCEDEVAYPTIGICKCCYAYYWYHSNIMTVKEELAYFKKQDRIFARVEMRKRAAKARPIKKRKVA